MEWKKKEKEKGSKLHNMCNVNDDTKSLIVLKMLSTSWDNIENICKIIFTIAFHLFPTHA